MLCFNIFWVGLFLDFVLIGETLNICFPLFFSFLLLFLCFFFTK